jgi:hypothetical protein
MVAIMKYEGGLVFTGIVCENAEVAQKVLKDRHWANPHAFEIIPVEYFGGNKDAEV